MELFWVLDRKEYHLLKLLFSIFQASNVFPLDVWNLYHCLSQRGWIHLAHRELKVILGHSHCFQDLSVDLIVLNINDVHLLTDALQGAFCAKGSNICSHKAVSIFGYSLKVHVLPQFHVLGVDS